MKNIIEAKKAFHLIREMFQTPDIVRQFDLKAVDSIKEQVRAAEAFLLTGEGSSRIFPAKNMVFKSLRAGVGPVIISESSNDLSGIDLERYTVFGASNSGRTKELINILLEQKQKGHQHLYGLSCSEDHMLSDYTTHTVVLNTGREQAVAASKSVVAQALFYELLFADRIQSLPDLDRIASHIENTLNLPIDQSIIEKLRKADHIFFAGLNNGVAEELALKTNETIRKKTAFLPGSYLLHGIEEVVTPNDVVVMVDDFPSHAGKIEKIYIEGIGATVVAFSHEKTRFATVIHPAADAASLPYVKLVTGWMCLLHAGLALGVNLDKPERVRKIGNEFSL